MLQTFRTLLDALLDNIFARVSPSRGRGPKPPIAKAPNSRSTSPVGDAPAPLAGPGSDSGGVNGADAAGSPAAAARRRSNQDAGMKPAGSLQYDAPTAAAAPVMKPTDSMMRAAFAKLAIGQALLRAAPGGDAARASPMALDSDSSGEGTPDIGQSPALSRSISCSASGAASASASAASTGNAVEAAVALSRLGPSYTLPLPSQVENPSLHHQQQQQQEQTNWSPLEGPGTNSRTAAAGASSHRAVKLGESNCAESASTADSHRSSLQEHSNASALQQQLAALVHGDGSLQPTASAAMQQGRVEVLSRHPWEAQCSQQQQQRQYPQQQPFMQQQPRQQQQQSPAYHPSAGRGGLNSSRAASPAAAAALALVGGRALLPVSEVYTTFGTCAFKQGSPETRPSIAAPAPSAASPRIQAQPRQFSPRESSPSVLKRPAYTETASSGGCASLPGFTAAAVWHPEGALGRVMAAVGAIFPGPAARCTEAAGPGGYDWAGRRQPQAQQQQQQQQGLRWPVGAGAGGGGMWRSSSEPDLARIGEAAGNASGTYEPRNCEPRTRLASWYYAQPGLAPTAQAAVAVQSVVADTPPQQSPPRPPAPAVAVMPASGIAFASRARLSQTLATLEQQQQEQQQYEEWQQQQQTPKPSVRWQLDQNPCSLSGQAKAGRGPRVSASEALAPFSKPVPWPQQQLHAQQQQQLSTLWQAPLLQQNRGSDRRYSLDANGPGYQHDRSAWMSPVHQQQQDASLSLWPVGGLHPPPLMQQQTPQEGHCHRAWGEGRQRLAAATWMEVAPAGADAAASASVTSRLSRVAEIGCCGDANHVYTARANSSSSSSNWSPPIRYAVAASQQQQQQQQQQQGTDTEDQQQPCHVVRRLYAAGTGQGDAAEHGQGREHTGIASVTGSPARSKVLSSFAAGLVPRGSIGSPGLLAAAGCMDGPVGQPAAAANKQGSRQLPGIGQRSSTSSSSRLEAFRASFASRGASAGASVIQPIMLFEGNSSMDGEVEFTSSSPVIISISPVPPSTAGGSPKKMMAGPGARGWQDADMCGQGSEWAQGANTAGKQPSPGVRAAKVGIGRPACLPVSPKAWRIVHGCWPSS